MRIGGILICDRSRPSSARNSLLRMISRSGYPWSFVLRFLVYRNRSSSVIDPNENLTGALFEGLDYEAIYILDSSIFRFSEIFTTSEERSTARGYPG